MVPDPAAADPVDRRWMARALALARRARFTASPNPMVGAVVVDAVGARVAEGYHVRAGLPHAEAVALERAGSRAAGSTVYVNLEPCAHVGRTPPCADALVAAGVRRVVVAMIDPDPRVRGQGIQKLREAGIQVELGLGRAEALELNRFYVHHRLTGRPYVSLKYAMTLDGRIATRSGSSRWISGPESRRHGHQLRAEHDAILVGVGTVLADDPELTVRTGCSGRQPRRVVLDSWLRTPPGARVLPDALVFCREEADPIRETALVAAGATVVRVSGGHVDPGRVLEHLSGLDVISVLVEGGSAVHGSFLEQGLVNRIYAYIAPKVVGGAGAPGPVGGLGVEDMISAIPVAVRSTMMLGVDLLVEGDVHRDR